MSDAGVAKPTFGSELFKGLTSAIPDPSNRNIMIPLVILIAGLVVGLILVFVDIYYPFLPVNPFSGPSSIARSGQTFWTNLNVDAQNLVVPVASSPVKTATDYTVSVQLLLQDSRTLAPASTAPFRHILHRGTNVCGISAPNPGPSGHSNIQLSDIPNPPPAYQQSGLPDFMNPGLFLDPVTNDLHVFVHTQYRDTSGQLTTLLESTTVPDLPLNAPLQIGVVLNGQTLEIYMNCRLFGTKLLKGQPYLPQSTSDSYSNWYGRACAYPVVGGVQNLTLWPAALNAGDYLQMCRGANFSNMSLSPVCATAGACSASPTSTPSPAPATSLSGIMNFGSSR